MKCVLALYEHSTIGFPGVKLKWTVEDGKVTSAFWTLKDIIQGRWDWFNRYPLPFIAYEMDSFNDFVRKRFKDDASVQG